jgi:hypothetical protein
LRISGYRLYTEKSSRTEHIESVFEDFSHYINNKQRYILHEHIAPLPAWPMSTHVPEFRIKS